jgi:bacteriocin biosynthesis cyclodehydratase domain-containing protein
MATTTKHDLQHKRVARRSLLGHLGVRQQTADKQLRQCAVEIVPIGIGGEASSYLPWLEALIEGWGMSCGENGSLAIVVSGSYLSPACRSAVHRLTGQGKSVLTCRPFTAEAWVGPLIEPGESCWDCITRCIALQHPHVVYLREHASKDDVIAPPSGFSEASLAWVFGYTAGCIVQHVLRGCCATSSHHAAVDHLISLEAVTGEQTAHSVAHGPRCAACCPYHTTKHANAFPVDAHALQRRFDDSSGMNRTAALEKALERVESLISPVTGIVSTLTTHSLLDV